MAVASTSTLLPLDRFAAVLGIHPLHFNQVDANIGSASSRVCIEPIYQYSWQHSDAISREELALSIMEAEDDISQVLGYKPAVTWEADERVELVHRPDTWLSHGWDIRGDRMSVKTKYGYVVSGGRKQTTLIDDDVAIAWSDTDSDGYKETATVVVATSVTDPDEISVRYPDQDESWEIRPTHVTISGGNATIVFHREQAVIKTKLESLDANTLSGLTDANFLDKVDVYRKYNDPSVQVQFVWRSDNLGCFECSGGGCTNCALILQNGCMTVKDAKLGIVILAPGTWNATDQLFDATVFTVCRRPDYVNLWYRAGRHDGSSMMRRWELAIAKLAISKLDRNICSCKAVSDVQAHWNVDLRRSVASTAQSVNYRVTGYELENNPFGTTVAAMDVWRLCRREMLGV
jgi:hypothetical protein